MKKPVALVAAEGQAAPAALEASDEAIPTLEVRSIFTSEQTSSITTVN